MPSTDNLISRVDHSVAHTTMRQQLRDQLIVAMVGQMPGFFAYQDGRALERDAVIVAEANRLAMAAYPEDPA